MTHLKKENTKILLSKFEQKNILTKCEKYIYTQIQNLFDFKR